MFWALRGGGAGSWGVIVDVTVRTFPIFNATSHTVNVLTSTLDQTNNLMTTHAKHVQDWNQTAAGQFYRLTGTTTNSTLNIITYFKGLDGNGSIAQMAPFLADAAALGATVQAPTILSGFANDVDLVTDDLASGINTIICSRFIPASVYSNTPELVGPAYEELLTSGISLVYAAMVAGGAFLLRDVLRSYLKAHHSHRQSGLQCRHRFSGTTCMAHGKVRSERSPRSWSQSNLTDSARCSPSKVGPIHCPPRLCRPCDRIFQRQLDLFSRILLVAPSVVATRVRATCSRQTLRSRSSAPIMIVFRGSSPNTTRTTYSSSRWASTVTCGTRMGCVGCRK